LVEQQNSLDPPVWLFGPCNILRRRASRPQGS
jgi:hypothetical protein